MNFELSNAVAIIAHTAMKPASQERHVLGFEFDPRRGHVLALGADQAANITGAVRARIKFYAGSAVTLGLSVQFENEAGEWSNAVQIAYSPDRVKRRAPTLPAKLDQFLIPPGYTQLDLVAVDKTGVAQASKRCAIPAPLFGAINAHVSRARLATYRPDHVSRQETMVARDMKYAKPVHDVVVDLFDTN
jgi:hypothetical protein